MGDECKDCKAREGCPVAAGGDRLYATGWKLAKVLGDAQIEPSPELVTALVGMACIVATSLGISPSSLKETVLRAIETLSKDLPPGTQVH